MNGGEWKPPDEKPLVGVKTLDAFVADMQARARAKGQDDPVFGVWEQWSVGFSVGRSAQHLSARLVVDASDEEDWKTLGRLAAKFGAPPEPIGGFPESAMASIHWDWLVPQ